MKILLQKLATIFKRSNSSAKTVARKSKGQSLVEFAIAFPVVIMLFSGVVEFGFILNYYLSLLDATRESARVYSGGDPFVADPDPSRNDTYWFYIDAAERVRSNLEPTNVNDTTRKIVLDPAKDDIIISVFSVCGNKIYSFPIAAGGGYHKYGNGTSAFTNASMLASRLSGAPNTGILLVEVIYNYHQVLALPWLTPFLSNPLPLRAYTIMPLHAAEYPMASYAPVITCP